MDGIENFALPDDTVWRMNQIRALESKGKQNTELFVQTSNKLAQDLNTEIEKQWESKSMEEIAFELSQLERDEEILRQRACSINYLQQKTDERNLVYITLKKEILKKILSSQE